MQLFYNPELTESSSEIIFNKMESGHIVKVLRKRVGEVLYITNGKGLVFRAAINLSDTNKCVAEVTSVEYHEKPWSYNLHMAVAPTKSNDRFEWFLEKATEIGIDQITPIFCERSERKVIKLERLEKIIHAASKQSLKYHFPKLNDPLSFTDFIRQPNSGQGFIAHCDNSSKTPLKNNLRNTNDYTILIGPEGDFSKREIMQCLEHKFIPVSLGESRLRTETAAVVAVHSVAFSYQ